MYGNIIRLPTNPGQLPDDDRDFAEPLGEGDDRSEHFGAGLRAAHHLDQAHHVRRAEEMKADDAGRTRGRGGDRVDVERGGVGREHRLRLGDAIDIAEDLLLELHVLEHRFDDQIRHALTPSSSRRGVIAATRCATASAVRRPRLTDDS